MFEGSLHTDEVKSIAAQNIFTTWARLVGTFQLLISGLATSTLTFQGSPDQGATVYDLETFNATTDNKLHIGTVANTNWVYRVGVKTGEYGSDTILVRIVG